MIEANDGREGVGRVKVWTDKQIQLGKIRANFTVLTTPQVSQEGRRAIKAHQTIKVAGRHHNSSDSATERFCVAGCDVALFGIDA